MAKQRRPRQEIRLADHQLPEEKKPAPAMPDHGMDY